MSRRTDEALCKAIREALDGLFDACEAAVTAGLEVQLDAMENDETKVPSIYAHVSRRYEVNP